MKFILMTLAAAMLASLTPAAAQAQTGIAYVNTERVLLESPQGQALAARYNQKQDDEMRQLDLKRAELQQMYMNYQQQELILDETARAQKRAAIERAEAELQQQAQDAEYALSEYRSEEMAKLDPAITAAIEAVRKEGLFGIVLKQESVAAADPSLDLTNAVIARLAASQ